MWQLLERLDLSYKRARHYFHSPDVHYTDKLTAITACFQEAQAQPDTTIFLYLDEFTFYRQPTLAAAYAARGSKQPLAYRSYRSNTHARVLAAMNALTGQVTYVQCSQTTLATFRKFYYRLRATYPQAERIYVSQDNWPVHAHPDIRVILEAQTFAWPPALPDNWSREPRASIKADDLPIQCLFQPTYAPWTNPIEKLWRWLCQDRLHLHRFSDTWEDLKTCVTNFLDQFSEGSPDLLRYTGLLPD
jgi:transposase